MNPKKSHFSLEEGKLMGNIVSIEGLKIDSVRVQEIQEFSITRSKRDIQYFLGKINFYQEVYSKLHRASEAHHFHAEERIRNKMDE